MTAADQGHSDNDGRPGRGWRMPWYGAVVFVSSACALILEIVAGRILAPYVGMSLYTWTAIIAVVLAGLSVGHYAGGRLAVVAPGPAHRRLAGALAAAAVTALASLAVLRLVAPALSGDSLDPIVGIVILAAAAFFLPSLFVGIVSPMLTRLAIALHPEASGRVIGRMFALGAAGSIAGTLLAGYLFISWVGSIGTIAAISATYLALALVFVLSAQVGRRWSAMLVIAAVVGAGGATAAGHAARAFLSPCDIESSYYCIRIVDFAPKAGRPSALMVIDHLGHGINLRDAPRTLYSPYLGLIDALLKRHLPGARHFSAFFIGGGAFTLPRAWDASYPDARLVVAEIDPAVTRAARQWMWYSPGTRTTVIHGDARTVLRSQASGRFDVIVGDAYRDIAIPVHLVSHEFSELVRGRLASRGFYVANVIDSGRDPHLVLALAKTLRRSFPVVEIWMSWTQVRGGGRATFVVFAGSRATAGNGRITLGESQDGLWVRWPPADLDKRLAAAVVPVLTDDYAPVDRLLANVYGRSQ